MITLHMESASAASVPIRIGWWWSAWIAEGL
jgi:hypothetical protein